MTLELYDTYSLLETLEEWEAELLADPSFAKGLAELASTDETQDPDRDPPPNPSRSPARPSPTRGLGS